MPGKRALLAQLRELKDALNGQPVQDVFMRFLGMLNQTARLTCIAKTSESNDSLAITVYIITVADVPSSVTVNATVKPNKSGDGFTLQERGERTSSSTGEPTLYNFESGQASLIIFTILRLTFEQLLKKVSEDVLQRVSSETT